MASGCVRIASSSDQRAARRVQASPSSNSRSSHSHSSEQSWPTATATATGDDAQMHRRAMRLEFLIGLSMRMRNQIVPCFFVCVCISLRCLQCGLPSSHWEILAGPRIIFSRSWTLDLARAIGRICSRYPSDDGVS